MSRSFTGYLCVEGPRDKLIKLLTYLRDRCNRRTSDVEDSIRILSNFDAFYEMMRKKFKDFIAPRKDEGDLIRGLVTVDKIKLIKLNGESAVIVLDKRVNADTIISALRDLGEDFECEL